MYNHPICCKSCTGNSKLGHFFNFNKAYPAVTGNRKARMPAEIRNINPVSYTGLHYSFTLREFYLFLIQNKFRHVNPESKLKLIYNRINVIITKTECVRYSLINNLSIYNIQSKFNFLIFFY